MTAPTFTNITTGPDGVQREAHGFIINGPVPRGLPDITEAIRLMKIALAADRMAQWVREHTPGSEPPADYYPVPEPSIDAAANWAAAENVAGFGRGEAELVATGQVPTPVAPVVGLHPLDARPIGQPVELATGTTPVTHEITPDGSTILTVVHPATSQPVSVTAHKGFLATVEDFAKRLEADAVQDWEQIVAALRRL